MKSLFIKTISSFRNQKGQALVFGSFFLMGLLLLGGIAVDTANLFHRKSQLRRAIDAAAMAGIALYESGVTNAGTIKTRTEQMANFNLLEMNIPQADITPAPVATLTVANQVATLNVTGGIAANTFFVRLLPGTEFDKVNISTSSSARRNPAVVSMVLDISGSMNCNGSCPQKFIDFKAAANNFVDSFIDGLDQIAIVTFSNTAEIVQVMAPVNKANLHTKINALAPIAWTNLSEGISLGRKQIETVNNPQAVKSLIVFGDGAPNYFRAYFTNAKTVSGFPRNYDWPIGGSMDWWDYILAVRDDTGTDISVKNPYNSSLPTSCAPSASDHEDDIRDCFNSLNYRDSRRNIRAGSSSVSMTSQVQMLRESYRLSIVEADYAKQDGTTVYTIGLGTPAPLDPSDPYQNPEERTLIKTYLMRRIANDPAGVGDPVFVNAGSGNGNLARNPNLPAGIYFQTPNPTELTSIFQNLAKRIKLKLIQ